MLRIFPLVIAAVTCTVILAACSGSGPSETDIQGALAKRPTARIGGGGGPGFPASDIKNLRKVECKEEAQNQQLCKVEFEAQQGPILFKTSAGVRLAKTQSGWDLQQ